ncbi:hypothetical protein AB0I81_21420 [Nonomuraea sp. NPDC050404]|uniref:hypothetical protein n=1 Tax=Nonomuraea sp. NPDC050404 TaxID=3155783 RepID=UPI0034030765
MNETTRNSAIVAAAVAALVSAAPAASITTAEGRDDEGITVVAHGKINVAPAEDGLATVAHIVI